MKIKTKEDIKMAVIWNGYTIGDGRCISCPFWRPEGKDRCYCETADQEVDVYIFNRSVNNNCPLIEEYK